MFRIHRTVRPRISSEVSGFSDHLFCAATQLVDGLDAYFDVELEHVLSGLPAQDRRTGDLVKSESMLSPFGAVSFCK